MEIALTVVSLIFVLVGVIFILKICGFIISLLGLGIMYFYAPSAFEILKNIK